jgi:hypothetical protein
MVVTNRRLACKDPAAMTRTTMLTAIMNCLAGSFVGLCATQFAAGAQPEAGSVRDSQVQAAGKGQWVWLDQNGRLVYKTLKTGDRIMDFSSAGYMGGGVALPTVPVKATVSPSGGDDTAAIQDAINSVSKLDLAGSFRGAVLLQPGAFNCKGELAIKNSGVVLRGSGSGPAGTTIKMTGSPHVCLSISGSSRITRDGKPARIVDSYVPSGTTSLQVDEAAAFRPGDTVLVDRPVTPAWVDFMGMHGLVRNGRKETWLADNGDIECERVVHSVLGKQLKLDLPLTDCFDAKYLSPPGGMVVKCTIEGGISQAGIESLRILAPPQPVEISQRHHQAVRLNGVTDAWLRDLVIEDTVNSVGIGNRAKRITVERVNLRHTVPTKGAAKPADFSASGSQVLFDRCEATGDNIFYFVTGAKVTGPNVLLNCVFHGNGHIQPHARWATGLLVDGCRVPESGIDFMNRGEMGSGHGWTIGWAVAWNCVAKSYIIQQPPGAANWAIGCVGAAEQSGMPFGHGPNLPEGLFDSPGTPVAPASLYLAQLRERLGAQAVRNIGY